MRYPELRMWFYVHNKKAEGPVSEEILHQLLKEDILPPTMLVWREGREEWAPARSVFADLFDAKDALPDTVSLQAVREANSPPSVSPNPQWPPPKPSQPQPSQKQKTGFWVFCFLLLPVFFGLVAFFMLVSPQTPLDRPHRSHQIQTTRPAPKVVPPPTAKPPAPAAPKAGGVIGRTTVPSLPPAWQSNTGIAVPTVLQAWQDPTGDYYFELELNNKIYVMGLMESFKALQSKNEVPPQCHSFSGVRSDGKAVVFEGEARDVKLVNRLIGTYNARHGSSLLLRELGVHVGGSGPPASSED